MRSDSAAWERAAEVRAAAKGWLRAGAIDSATHQAIESRYPDPCVTPSLAWRALTAVIVTAVMLCTLAASWIMVEPDDTGLVMLLLLLAVACLVATERLEAAPRLARRGAAGATSFWGIVFLLAALVLLLAENLGGGMRMSFDAALTTVLLAGALAWGAACWRWGSPLFAGLSAVSLFLFLARLPQGRVLWVLAGAALAALAARRLDEASWAPSHRRAAAVLVAAGLAAVYAAVNVYSLDERLLEELRPLAPAHGTPAPGRRGRFALATAALPLLVLLWGWRSRRTFLLDVGIVLAALSLVTLRHYVHVAPLWVALAASGAALVAGALAVERALRRAPGAERGGFTADPIFSDERRLRVLEVVPVVAAFTPPASAPAAEDRGFAGKGGQFGGGGASDRF